MQYVNILSDKFKEYRIKTEFIPIGFCGKLYPCISFLHMQEDVEIKRVSTYSTDTTLEYIEKLTEQFGKIEFIEEYYQGCEPTYKDLDNYFYHKVYSNDYSEWFQEIESPIFKFTENPKLEYDMKQRK